MTNTARVLATVLALAFTSGGYVASVQAMDMKKDDKMMMMKKHKKHKKMKKMGHMMMMKKKY